MTTITPLKAWLLAATTDEKARLADRCATSVAYLRHLAANEDKTYRREPRTELAQAIERETRAMNRASRGRLPVVLRTDLVQACRECEYARRCLGAAAVGAGHFPIVTDDPGSEGGTPD